MTIRSGTRSFLDGSVEIAWAPVAAAEPLLRPLVARMTGLDPGPLHHSCPRCGSVEHGRPYVEGPASVSVAHATGLTVVAVSMVGSVGVDVEPEVSASWVRREAVGKALGTGLLAEPLPEPTWSADLDIPHHVAAVAVVS
jgi:phosphopantetheinyl transferase